MHMDQSSVEKIKKDIRKLKHLTTNFIICKYEISLQFEGLIGNTGKNKTVRIRDQHATI